VERRAGDVDGFARFLGHPLPDAARLKHCDPVPDQERAGRFVGRVKEHRPKVSILRLEPADDRIPTSDVDKAGTIDVERERRQRLSPGTLGIDAGDAVDLTRNRGIALADDHRGRAAPALYGKGHHDRIAQPRPATKMGGLDVEIKGSSGDQLEAAERDGG
jgi:hypothetical protein